MKDKLRAMVREKQSWLSAAGCFVFWLLAILYFEGLLHHVVYEEFALNFLYCLGFSAGVAGVLTLLLSFLPKKAGFITSVIVLAVLMVLYGSQLIYRFIFGTLYSVSQVQQGGAALTSFWKETVATVRERFGYILLLFVPLAGNLLLWFRGRKLYGPSNWFVRATVAATTVIICSATVLSLKIGGTGFFSDYYFYHSSEATTTQTAERFGLLTAMRLELTGSPADVESQEETYFQMEAEETVPRNTESVDETLPEEERKPAYNILNLDFEKLNGMTENKLIRSINDYCGSLTGTNTNAYTGMLGHYNLITICAESFSPGAIHPELTPTLYRLANEGFVFNNFYTTYPNNTTDGEYSIVMGLYPDSSRGKVSNSFYASRNSYLPFTLGKAFYEQVETTPYFYHNYQGSFYGRDETHVNLGYTTKFAGKGMRFTTSWPASDLEMMEQSVDDYISADKQFHAYYMTFSGHYKYDPGVNPMAAKNWDLVKDLPMSHASKAYLACNIELDRALEYLMRRLEEAGVEDKTAIVLAADHYPYGLSDAQYGELVDYEIDAFSKYKSTLIFWVGGMEEPVAVDTYCSNVDILPTILNLWGFSYDSRMLAGTDVFSNGIHVAVLSDRSFFTDKVWFRSGSGKVKYLVDESDLPENYVENMIKLIKTKFSLSANILNSAYYNFVYEKGDVKVSKKGWISQEDWDRHFGIGVKDEEPEEVPEEVLPPATVTPPESETPPTPETPPEPETPPTTEMPPEPEVPPVEEDPLGSAKKPASLKTGRNTAELKAGNSGYYYTWKAPADGELTITLDTGRTTASWFYKLSNVSAEKYGKKHTSADQDPVLRETIKVEKGDRIQLIVGTYAASGETPAGKVCVKAEFAETPDETTVPPTEPETETTEPVTEPAETEPAVTEPATEPEITEPAATEPSAEPETTEPAVTQPDVEPEPTQPADPPTENGETVE